MKSLAIFRSGRAVLSARALSCAPSAACGAAGPGRLGASGAANPAALPPAGRTGIPLSLDEAIGYALANNQDLNVTVNAAEASQYLLFSNDGIFDPVLQAFANRAHNEQPAAFDSLWAPPSLRPIPRIPGARWRS